MNRRPLPPGYGRYDLPSGGFGEVDYTDPVLYCLSPKGTDLRCWPHCSWWRKFECKKGKLEERYKICRKREK